MSRLLHVSFFFILFAPTIGWSQTPSAVAEEIDKNQDPQPTIGCQSFIPPEELPDAQRAALRGVACFEEEKYIQALRHYRRAFEVSESPLLMGAIGRVFQEIGYPALAREYYNSYLIAESDPDGKAKISARLGDVEAKLEADAVSTRIETNPPGSRIYFVMEEEHWELAGESPLEVDLLPGEYDIVIRRDGFLPAEEKLVVRERTSPGNINGRVHRYQLMDPNSVFETSATEWRERGIATTIISVPFVAAGATMLAVGLGKGKDAVELQDAMLRDEMNRDANRLKTWGTAAIGVGATGLIVGTILYLVGLDEPDEGASDVQNLVPEAGTGGVVFRFD